MSSFNSANAISFYNDTLIIETILGSNKITKNATSGVMSELLSKVKEYVDSKIDPKNKVESLANILGPGIFSMGLRALGLGWLPTLFAGIAMSALHINIGSIISSIWNSLKGMLSGDKKVNSQQIDSVVNNAIQQEAPLTDEQKAEFKTQSFDKTMREARMLRLAMEEYQQQSLRLTNENFSMIKEAGPLSFFGRKAVTTSLLSKIIGWIFKVALASAGLMIAGDVVNKFLGRPNSLDKTYQAGKEKTEENTLVSVPVSTITQSKFPLKSDSPLPSMIPLANTPENISLLIVQWAKDVYSGLDGQEQNIKNSPGFKAVKDRISWYNVREGDQGIFIPKNFSTKKALVDLFINDVAENAK